MKNEEFKDGINYYRLLNALADSIIDTPDHIVIEAERVASSDSHLLVDKVKRVIENADLQFRKSQLTNAKEAYEKRIAEHKGLESVLPPSAEGKKALFLAVLKMHPNYKRLATFQHRNFEELTEDDIDSALKQFYELGLLNHLKEEKNK